MNDDRIESETLIAAPLERVWSLVAEPGFWVAETATISGTVAREGETMIAKNPHHGDFPVRVEKVTPPTYLAYRWASAFPGQALVSFTAEAWFYPTALPTGLAQIVGDDAYIISLVNQPGFPNGGLGIQMRISDTSLSTSMGLVM